MKTEKTFEGKHFKTRVIENVRGAHCVIVSGESIKSAIPGVKSAVRFFGCRTGEEGKAKSLALAEEISKAKSLPKSQAKKKK